jgi:hypothetical protein
MDQATRPIASKLALLIAAGLFSAGCAAPVASTASSSRPAASKAAKEDFVTGSRIPRSESNENYQGTKSIGSRDYDEYLGAIGRRDKGN